MIDLHYWTTPNGHKVTMFLEETGTPYKIFPVNIGKGEQFKAEFLAISPNNRIPAMVDHDPPGGGKPLSVFESGAMLVYLAEKTGQFLPNEPAKRADVMQWLFWQMGGLGPMFGQLGFFHKFAGREYEDKRPRDRYVAEAKRLLAVLEGRLEGRNWIMGDDYTIADVATLGWVRNLIGFYEAGEIVDFASLRNVPAWLERGLARPAVQRGLTIPSRG
jgi:GSH-dependent disulfide-bond oxidoreductase